MADERQVKAWLEGLQRERQSKLGETSGVGDILSLLMGRQAPKLSAATAGAAEVDRLTGADQSPFDEGMAFPVFGVGKTGRLAAAHRRIKGNETKELPFFSDTGLMAPARQKELEKRMREWIPQTSTSDAKHLDELMSKFVAERPGWGKVPMEKGGMTDKMHSKLRQSYYQALKEMGYGGIKYPGVREYNPKLATGTSRPVEVLGGPQRPWEEILKFEQGGNNPANWEKNFRALQELEAALPAKPKTKTVGGR